jgi:hypothetical protein
MDVYLQKGSIIFLIKEKHSSYSNVDIINFVLYSKYEKDSRKIYDPLPLVFLVFLSF